MCELCENNLMDDYSRIIIKINDGTYEIQKWENKCFEIDSTYELIASMKITECPDCHRKLGG